MSYTDIALLMFFSMMALLATGQRMYGVIGFVGIASALALWGPPTISLPFDAAITTLNWSQSQSSLKSGERPLASALCHLLSRCGS